MVKISNNLTAGYVAGVLTAFNFGYLANTEVEINGKVITDLKKELNKYIVLIDNAIDESLSPRSGFGWWVRENDDNYILYKFNSLDFEDGFNDVFEELGLDSSNFVIGQPFDNRIRIKTLPNYKVPYYGGAYEVAEFDYE